MTFSNRSRFVLLAAALVVIVAPTLGAQDISGSWLMETTVNLPDSTEPCVYGGDCEMTQVGDQLSGTVDLALVSGPAECPPEMTASLDGQVEGDAVFGTLEGPQGQAGFQGSRANSFIGSFLAEDGDFEGSEGEWLAVRPSVLDIPTLSAAGFILLVLALLAAGAWVFRTRQQPV